MARRRITTAKLHPFVDAMINTAKTASVILAEHPELSSPMFEAMRAQSSALKFQIPSQEAIDKSAQVSTEGEDRLAATIFHWMWAEVSRRSGRLAECSALLARTRGFLAEAPGAPPEMEGFQLDQEAGLAAAVGDMVRAGELHGQVLSIVPASSPKRVMFLGQCAHFLAPLWRMSEIEPQAAELAGEDAEAGAAILAVPRLIHSIEMCDPAGMRRQMTLVERKEQQDRRAQSGILVFARQLARLLEAGSLLPGTEADTGVSRNLLDLMQGKPAAALDYIRGHLSRDLDVYLASNQFVAFNLVRAELACGHGSAAGRVMATRHRRGNFHPLDDFFLARVELLAGNRTRAAELFQKTLSIADRCGAQQRIDFELRMARELSPADALWLSRSPVAASGRAASPPAAAAGPRIEVAGADRLLGVSEAMAEVRRQIRQMAPLDVPVLIVGETGTGKELAARAIHDAGPRSGRPFVAINCGAIVEGLLESELFGYERGAFTGAATAHKGLFEQAGDGTLLLDEIGEIPPRLQVALLRVLETGEIRPVGGHRARRTGCRIVAATNAELDRLVDEGRFRRDLLYRLKRLEIRMPSLRERREDILPLAERFLREGRTDGSPPTMSADLHGELLRRDWPGNVRELRNVIERMRLLNSDGEFYDLAALSRSAGEKADAPTPAPAPADAGPAPRATPGTHPAERDDALMAELAGSGRVALRRLERLRGLFRRHEALTRVEVMKVLGVSQTTATRDLKTLAAEGLVEKVTPSASPRSHYFRLRS